VDGALWLFGGNGIAGAAAFGDLNDLWRFDPTTRQWAWYSGANSANASGVYGGATPATSVPSADNTPGARRDAFVWPHSVRTFSGSNLITVDEFWLFGGDGVDAGGGSGRLNDMWKFSPRDRRWTWIRGSNGRNDPGVYGSRGSPAIVNIPGARVSGAAWRSPTGDFWLFGGLGTQNYLHEIWKFTPPCGPTC
jgi:hypothetical protein